MTAEKIHPGQVLYLASGGLPMTVLEVHSDAKVSLCWQDRAGEVRQAKFPAVCLRNRARKVPPRD